MDIFKKLLFLYSLFFTFMGHAMHEIVSLSPSFVNGKYKISKHIQNFIEDFQPTSDRRQLITLFNNVIDSFANQDTRDFFVHTLNMTMLTNMKDLNQIQSYLDRTVDIVNEHNELPSPKKSVVDRLVGLFTEKSLDDLFDESLAGDKNALLEIKQKVSALKNVSESQKREILKNLEARSLIMLRKVDEEMPQQHAALEEKYETMRTHVENQFEIVSGQLDHSSDEFIEAQKKYHQDLDNIMNEQKEEIAKMRTTQESRNYLVLKHCQDIVNALNPMLKTQYDHIMFTYDRSNNSSLLNLLNFKDFDLSAVNTEQELDDMIQTKVRQLNANQKIDLPVHRETKSKFNSLVKREILEHHPDLVVPAKKTGHEIIMAEKEGDEEYKEDVLFQHHQYLKTKPYWQREQINSNLNRHLLEHTDVNVMRGHANIEIDHSVIA